MAAFRTSRGRGVKTKARKTAKRTSAWSKYHRIGAQQLLVGCRGVCTATTPLNNAVVAAAFARQVA